MDRNKGQRTQWVVYHDEKSDRWVAHGLDTNQIGTGKNVLLACVCYFQNMMALTDCAKEHPDIEVHRDASETYHQMLAKAVPVPNEVVEIAYKMAKGQWPKEIGCEFVSPDDTLFAVSFEDEAAEVSAPGM